jgi:SAM-dependent methyltransferase
MPPTQMWESFFDPAGILDAFGCRALRGDAVEFGCGYGTFTVDLAGRVSGTVYALDVDPDMVNATATRVQQAGARNVVVEHRDFVSAGSGRPDRSVATVLLFNILHMEDPVALFRESRRILCEGGTASVIHWRDDIDTPRGPPLDIRPTPDQCRVWAQQAGLRFAGMRGLPESPWHWGLLLERSD